MAPKLDPWIRVFDVSSPVKHEKGYTLYKVTSKVFPRNSPEAATEVVVWKRYSEFKKLHKMLQTLHTKLYLKGTFPSFAKSRLFGRFDDEVIEERRKSALQLLEFAAQHPPLFTSQIFVKFIEESQCISGERKGYAFKQTKISAASTEDDKITFRNSESTSFKRLPENPQWNSSENNLIALGGVCQHNQSQDSISISSTSEEYSESDGDSILSTLVSTSDVSLFDPLAKIEEKPSNSSSSYNASNSWLLSNLITNTDETTMSKDKVNLTDHISSFENVQNKQLSDKTEMQDEKISEHSSNTANLNPLKWKQNAVAKTKNTDGFSYRTLNHSYCQLSTTEETDSISKTTNLSKPFQKDRNENLSNTLPSSYSLSAIPPINFSSNDPSGEYLCEAATNISLAQENEANGIYDLAFTHYKAGVATLLKGVQNDNNNARREAVRTKTAQYLMRAEEIYKKHLSGITQDKNRWDTNSKLSPSHEKDLNLRVLQAPENELKNYRVLGVIDKIQLVLDTTTNKTYALKVLRKSPTLQRTVHSIIPSKIPYMVQLYKYIETDYALFLILQHAVGGKLFAYIKSFLQNSPQSPCYESQGCNPPVLHTNQIPTSEGNIYSGKNMLQDTDDLITSENISNGNEKLSELKITDSRDLDLVAESECSSSYTQLFTTYAASLQPEKYIGLAKCNIQYQETMDGSPTESDLLDMNTNTKDVLEYLTTCHEEDNQEKMPHVNLYTNKNCSEETDNNSVIENFPSETVTKNSEIYDINNINNIENLEHLDAQDLINYSQKLLSNVDKTLRESYDTKNIHSELITVKEKFMDADEQFISLENQESKFTAITPKTTQKLPVTKKTRQDSCESNPQEKPKNQRKHSEDSVFASPIHEGRLSSSTGSLSSKPRLRHFSMVFQQLDKNAETNYLPESCIRVWAAEMVIAISNLHNLGIICRDLRPDNILLGERGHVLLSYFSQWNCVDKPYNLEASESLYSAPEVNGFSSVTPVCDWWSLGALIFELLTAKTFASCHPGGITSHTPLNIPGTVSLEGQLLLKQLLTYNINERLGSPPNGVEAIKRHPFFNGYDWDRHAS